MKGEAIVDLSLLRIENVSSWDAYSKAFVSRLDMEAVGLGGGLRGMPTAKKGGEVFDGFPRGKTVSTTCVCNCGGTSACVIKAHVKEGKVIRVEPDDRYNPGVGMEDKVLSLDDLVHNRLQRRPG